MSCGPNALNRIAGAALLIGCLSARADAAAEPPSLPRWDHIVVVVEENKDYEQIIGNKDAPYLNQLAAEGVNLTQMYAEEHPSEGNYFFLFAGDDLGVGFYDEVPIGKFDAPNLGARLIAKGLSFKGYAEGLPEIGADVNRSPAGCGSDCLYGRKHVPWISFSNVPNGGTVDTSSNLRFADFPADYDRLPTVAIVVPDLEHDMHNGAPRDSVPKGDAWLRANLDAYYQWAKAHNSLLVVTFDENADRTGLRGPTDPAVEPDHDPSRQDRQNRIPTILAGAHVKPGFEERQGLTHVNLLRTIEAVYGLPKSGAQAPAAVHAGIGDDRIVADAFAIAR